MQYLWAAGSQGMTGNSVLSDRSLHVVDLLPELFCLPSITYTISALPLTPFGWPAGSSQPRPCDSEPPARSLCFPEQLGRSTRLSQRSGVGFILYPTISDFGLNCLHSIARCTHDISRPSLVCWDSFETLWRFHLWLFRVFEDGYQHPKPSRTTP